MSDAPMIDAHNHLGRWLSSWVGRAGDWVVPDVAQLLDLMDTRNIEAIVNLDGRWGAELEANLDRYDRAHPGRFATFAHADWSHLQRAPHRAGDTLADELAQAHQAGAKGLKVWKDLGLTVRDNTNNLVLPDDPRIAPLFDTAGALGLPVLIHTADPIAFWAPMDNNNERLDELAKHPEWWYGDATKYPSYANLMESFVSLVAAHPDTTFIGAHVCSSAEDLDAVADWLAALPNLHLDISARLAKLGRRPRAAAALIERFPDRVLFGTDAFPPTAEMYALHVRALETRDQDFSYSPDPDDPEPQGRWRISGLDLPPAQLAAIYTTNARRLIAF